jgi:very-short-patch-repair endonuclease
MGKEYGIKTIKCTGCGQVVTKRLKPGRRYCSADCFRKSKRPQRKTGKIILCNNCSKSCYQIKARLEKSKNQFCSLKCANEFQGRNKIIYNCKTCNKQFKWSKSRITQANPKYCSIECRNNDKEHIALTSLKGNLSQLNKKGLNRLEKAGNDILNELRVEYKTQVPMFNKFIVDVLIEDKKLVIQWDGEYWHTKEKRKRLDQSQDAYLKKCGYKVLRITDRQIKENINRVYDYIRTAI